MAGLNLNENIGGGLAIFNNGDAGRVDGVKLSIEKKDSDDTSNKPDYKILITDENGGSVNQGFYYPSQDDDDARFNQLIGRILSIAKAVIPADFLFKDVAGMSRNEIVDYIFSVAKQFESRTLVNVFVNYGTVTKPSIYLSLRYFNFIERPDAARTGLTKRNTDVLVRPEQDAPKTDAGLGGAPAQDAIPGWGI